MLAKTNVTAVPFRSSGLAVPPSPSSPVDTIAPPSLKRTYSATANVDLIDLLPPPTRQPMKWLWACHLCNCQYNLSVTRRCLDDGHYFCAGTSVVRSRKDGAKRLRRHKACASEFDYADWKDWGVWKRNLLTLTEQQRQRNSPCDSVFDDSEDEDLDEIYSAASVISPITAGVSSHTSSWRVAKPLRPVKDCWNRCDYPSECRWGKQFGVDTPLQTTFPSLDRVPSTPNPNIPSTTDIVDVEMIEAPTELTKTQFKDILTAEQQSVADTIDGVDIEVPHTHSPTPALADLASLVSRAQRRHSRSEIPLPVSPLAVTSTQQGLTMVTRSSSRESLRRAVEGGIGVIAGIVGWRSSSAPPGSRRKEEVVEVESEDVVMADADVGVQVQDSGRGRGRRKSLG